MDWLLAIVALCLVIIIHEFGHYLAAVATGMRVDRFSVFGIGPVILRLGRWRGTEFVISAIPFGAYVMIQGMEPEEESPATTVSDSQSPHFRDRPLWQRFLVLVGGPAANYAAATVMFFAIYAAAGAETVEIGEFAEVSAAREAGLEVGDGLLRIGDTEIDPAQGGEAVVAAAARYLGQTVDVTVARGEERITRSVTLPAEPPALGVSLSLRPSGREVPLASAAQLALSKPWVITGTQLTALGQLVTGRMKADVSGPVGIVKHIKRSAEAGLVPFLMTAAFISTLLGLFNLLPLPALDGGRIAFLGYEVVARRPASGRVEGLVHGVGMLALLALIAFATIGDIKKL